MTGQDINSRLLEALSDDLFSVDTDDLKAFNIVNPILDPGRTPTYVVRPREAEELQELIRLANKKGFNLVPVSSTGRHSKGGILCLQEQIVVDLSSWKKIKWINRRNRVCQIEPGVTYGQLTEALAGHGLTLSMPLAPRDGKSVLAAVMDREPSTWPNKQWDSGDPVASTEFIFGNGELFRTGAAGGPGTLEEQRAAGGAQKSSSGPSQADFHRVVQGSQGTMAMVTWITLRTEVRPTIQKPCLLGADSLDELIPYVYEVQRPWLGEHSFILDRTAAAMLMLASGGGSFEAVRESLPRYVCLQNIAGFERLPKERIKYQEADIKDIARRLHLDLASSLGRVSAEDMLQAATRPCGRIDWRHKACGHCLSVFFLTTLDRAPGLIRIFHDLAQANRIETDSIGQYVQPIVQNHTCHVELMLPFDPDDPAWVETMRRIEKEAVIKLARAGAFFSRPYGSSAEVVFNQNPLNYEILKKVKNIFDPNKVLNKGKWGL